MLAVQRKGHLQPFLGFIAIALSTAGAAATIATRSAQWLALLTAGLSPGYFLQQHYLRQLTLFNELFWDFNKRYAELNDELESLVGTDRHLTDDDRALLYDYFDLCAVEYFDWRRGVIDREVWVSWCRGMLKYLADDPLLELWAAEERRASYYGLTRDKIGEAAGSLADVLEQKTSSALRVA